VSRTSTAHQLESQLLVLVTLALVAFGLVMVYSATSASATLGHGNSTAYLERQGLYALIGLAGLWLALRTDYRRWQGFAPALVLAAVVLCLAVLVIGTRVNGARRWISFGPAAFQPSELAKLALAVWTAAYLARRPAPRTLGELARPLGLLVGIFCALVLAEPDLGTAIAIVVMVSAMLLVAGTPLPTLFAGGAIVTSVGLAAIWLEPYRRARLFAFLNPWHDAQGAGFQIVQALIGLGSGGIFGRGLGEGVQKIHFLPEAHTDMIAAVIGEELGLVGLTALVAAYCAFAYAGIRLALGCRDPFGKRLATGLTALVCGQAIINLAAVLGVAPLTGIPLPFVSYGGSSLIVDLLAVGILLNIARGHGKIAVAQVPDRSRRDGGPRAAGARGGGRAAGARRQRDVRRVAGSRRSSARS
jgi:cell division protein FtsW